MNISSVKLWSSALVLIAKGDSFSTRDRAADGISAVDVETVDQTMPYPHGVERRIAIRREVVNVEGASSQDGQSPRTYRERG